MATSTGTGAFNNGSTTGVAYTAFDPSISRVNSYNQGSSAGGYTVRAGETLASIAANLWGDSSLWYKLAEANGLSGQAALSEGQSIRIPAGVMKNTHNASTFQPYDPSDTIGDTAPTAAKPPKKNKCGVFGQVLLVVVAVAVAVVTKNLALGAEIFKAGTAAAAITTGVSAGVAGSVASQAVGVATGIQEKFSWNAVAQAAISGGVGGGLGLESTSGWGQAAANAAVQNIASQGLGLALGLQKKFSWASVAAAGVSGGVGFNAGKQLGNHFGGGKIGEAATTAFVATASSIAYAATRTAIEGSNFGDNLQASIPDIIGQALGGAIGKGVAAWAGSHSSVTADIDAIQAATNAAALANPKEANEQNLIRRRELHSAPSMLAAADAINDLVFPDEEAFRILATVRVSADSFLLQKIDRHSAFQTNLSLSMLEGRRRAEQSSLPPAPTLIGFDPNTDARMFHTPIDPLSEEWMALRRDHAVELGFVSETAAFDPLSLHTLITSDGSQSLWVPNANPLNNDQLNFIQVVDPAEARIFIQLTETFGAVSGWLRMPDVAPTVWTPNINSKATNTNGQ
jgi:hypothetical protein